MTATDTCLTVVDKGTQVTSDSVDESIVDVAETGVTVLELYLDQQVATVDGGTIVEVGLSELTGLEVVESATTVVDLYGGPQGRPGPTVVSADAYNVAYLGTDGLLFVPEKARMSLDVEIDESDSVSLGYVYVGEASPGTASSDAAWRIKRIKDSGAVTSIDWANGDASSINVWDNRKTLTYGP